MILLDELVTFAHQLSDNRSEAFASYMPSLQGTAKRVPGISTVGSLLQASVWNALFLRWMKVLLSSRLGQNLFICR